MALPIIQKLKLNNKREFAKAALNANYQTFVIHIVALEALKTNQNDDPSFLISSIGSLIGRPDLYQNFA